MKVTYFILICFVVQSSAIAKASKKRRIAGGQNATKGQFPWLVSLQATNFQEGWHLCGGTLITPEWVLIAAHCLDSEQPQWLWVVAGEHDRSVEEGTEQYLPVDYFITHPEYTYWQTPYHNDVALIHLTTPAAIDLYTNVAPVPVDSSQVIVEPCIEAGWGITEEGGAGADILQYTSVPLLTPEYCQAAYSFSDPMTLCAGELSGGVGSCIGDNGGGLVCWDLEQSAYIVGGIMSWRSGCAQVNSPAVYMNVAKYRDWIISIIDGSSQGKPNLSTHKVTNSKRNRRRVKQD